MPASESSFVSEIGRYQVVRLLGQGAMGRVYLAHDPVLDRDVAIKVLRDDLNLADDQRTALLERMRQEARASARVSHPNIVALYDMGELADLGLFLVFEYVEGPSLKEKIGSGGVGPEAAARIAREVGNALTTAHDAGVLHRDIKPENIIVSKTGAKVADFGIARVPDSTLTRDGGLLGTPAYSAPEAIAVGTFSPLSDQFSLAATLYEAVSLHRAFPGDDAVSVATKIANDEPPSISPLCGLDPRTDLVLGRAFSKNPSGRFKTCDDFGRALADALESSPRSTQATLPDARHQVYPPQARGSRSFRVALGGAALGALVAFAVMQLAGEVDSENVKSAEAFARTSSVEKPVVGWLAESKRTSSAPLQEQAPSNRKPKADPTPEPPHPRPAAAAPVLDAGSRPLPSTVPGPVLDASPARLQEPETADTDAGR